MLESKIQLKIFAIALCVMFLLAARSTAAAQVTISNIDQMTGWGNCTVCAGIGAKGPVATYSMVENQASPSLDGHAAKFSISGKTPYSDALWWKQLGARNSTSSFTYDIYFYLTNPQNAQALEFDANQSNGAHKFIFGTQCNIKNGAQFDIWDNANARWVHTGISCTAPSAYKWHHLVWNFKRTSSQVVFVSVTLDGATHYVNRSNTARASGANELNIAVQLDGDYAMHTYSMWVDKATLKAW